MSDMKLLQFLPAACLATTLLLAACTQDDLSSPTGGVEEASPLHFAASIGPATRATTDGSWEGTEYLQVQIVDNYTSGTPQWDNSTQQTYTVTGGGAMNKTRGEDAYWQANGEVKAIRAWYDADNSSTTTLSADHSVKTDQSGDGYTQSDFLFAQRIAEFTELREKDIDMTFYHQVAKVKVNILKGDETPTGLSSITRLTIGGIATSGTFTAPALDSATPLGTWNATGEKQSITPHAVTTTGDNTLATYEALIIPQTVNGNTQLFTISANGYSDFVYTPTEAIEWQSGMEYTYDITIKGSELEVSTSQSIGWNTGSTGSGSVTLPTEIDLSQATGNITIEDDNTYLLTGSGSTPVTIRGNATLILQNVSLNTSTGNAISVESGNPTIHVKGTSNSVTGNAAGIYVASGSTLTITGDSRDDVLTAQANGDSPGIGGYTTNNATESVDCGQINISNVTVYAYGGSKGHIAPGIGAAGSAGCDGITIKNAKVYAYGTGMPPISCPAIGQCADFFSSAGSLPTIIISDNSEVYAHRGLYETYSWADYIGCFGGSNWDQYKGENAIQLGTGGSITNSTIYCYTGETQLDKTVEYDENGKEIE